MGEVGKCWSKGTKLQLCRMNKPNSEHDDFSLNIGNLLKKQISVFSPHTQNKVTMRGDDMLTNLIAVIM